MKKYAIILCDDDKDQLEKLQTFITRAIWMLEEPDLTCEIVAAKTSYQAILKYLNEYQPQNGIYFLDIELSQNSTAKNGLDLAEVILQQDKNAQIIFNTAYENFAIMTYQRRMKVLDYLVKTSDDHTLQKRLNETLALALKRLRKAQASERVTFSYKMGRRIISEEQDDILYLVTTGYSHTLRIVTKNGEAEFLGDLKKVHAKAPFLEPLSRSCLANPEHITELDLKKRIVKFTDGTFEVVSRRNLARIAQLFV